MVKIIEDFTHLYITGEPEEISGICETFKFQPEGFFFSPRYKLWQLSGGREGWDGYVHPVQRTGMKQATALRGRREELVKLCDRFGYEVDTTKLLDRPFTNLTLEDIPAHPIEAPYDLDEYQRQGIQLWLKWCIGINQISIGGGKTAMYAGVTAMLKGRYPNARAIYMTPSERLVRQVTSELRKFLPKLDIGQMGGGKHEEDAKDIVVCTVAILNKHFNTLSSKGWFKTFDAIYFDEVHHSASPTAKKVVLAIPAYYRFGASDTIKKDDAGKNADIRGLFGNIMMKVATRTLIDRNRLAVPHIYVERVPNAKNKFAYLDYQAALNTQAWCLVNSHWKKGIYLGPVYQSDADGNVKTRRRTNYELGDQNEILRIHEEQPLIETGLHRIEIDGAEYHIESKWCLLQRVYDEAIVRFKERNDLIVNWACRYSAMKYPTLVVCTRTLHLYILEAMLCERLGSDFVRILFGDSSPAQRDETFDWFRSTPGSVLLTPLVKEGVSINEIRAGVIADYVADPELANQIIGRFIRKKEGRANFAEITWFKDIQHPVLNRGSSYLLKQFMLTYSYPVYDPPPSQLQELPGLNG